MMQKNRKTAQTYGYGCIGYILSVWHLQIKLLTVNKHSLQKSSVCQETSNDKERNGIPKALTTA